jgi:hypothetical protein
MLEEAIRKKKKMWEEAHAYIDKKRPGKRHKRCRSMRGLKDPDGGGLLPCRDDGRRRCFVRRRRLSSPWQLSCFGFLFLYGCAGETMTDYLCVDGSSISPSIDTRRGHWKTFSASCFFGPVWIHGLELVLASLAPTNPETSKQGGLDWVRCN